MPPSWLNRLSVDHGFGKAHVPDIEHLDWSRGLGSSSTGAFAEGLLSTSNIALHGEISALAVEPLLGYLAVGTTVGGVHLFGKDAVQIDWSLRPANKVQQLLFKSGSPLLVAIDAKDNVSIFDLSRNDPQLHAKAAAAAHPFTPTQATTNGAGPSGPLHPDTPMRIGAYSARNAVLCAEVSPLHSHLFLGLRDGTIDAYDLDKLVASPYRVPNLWWEEEEILRRSGVPDAPSRRHVPLIVDIKSHPKDINQLLLAYEGGVVLLDVAKRTIVRSFQLRHLPGAPGAGVGDPDLIWTERAVAATCLAWRPDGLVFACGHEDGCISLWHVEDDEKPISVRTLERVDVDKPNMDMAQGQHKLPQSREPIFKLTWSGFPAQSWLEMAQHATDQQQQQQQQHSQEGKEEPATGTILTVLGGATDRQPSGLACLHFPAFSWPYASYWNSKTPDALAKIRQALRASLEETHGSLYTSTSTVEDFVLLPRDSPYYGLSYDPVAVITLVGPDARLPPLPPPAAARGLKAFAFPPPSSRNAARPESPTLPVAKNERLGTQLPFAQRPLHLPLALSTAGSGAILGAKLVDVSPHVHRTLTAQADASRRDSSTTATATSPLLGTSALLGGSSAQSATIPHLTANTLPLRGGQATPTVSGTHADTAEAFATLARAERWRLLITWHLDGTVRFHDASPQLLLIGTEQKAMASGQDGSKAFTPGHLSKSFPSPLPHLTIDVRKLIDASTMDGHPLFERLKADGARLRIATVRFAPDAMETAIALRTGQVLHYKFGFAKYSQTDDVVESVAEDVRQDEEVAAQMAQQYASPPSYAFGASAIGSAELERSMAGAMHDLDLQGPPVPQSTSSSHAPPPRPRRDPMRAAAGHARTPSLGTSSPSVSGPVHVDTITHVGHLATWRSDGFKPNIIVELNRGEVSAMDVSDIGFMAIACGPSLAVIDLRGPQVIVREGFGDGRRQSESGDVPREERKVIEEESKSGVVQQVLFSICRTMANAVLAPTLLVVRETGFCTSWTLRQVKVDDWQGWVCERSQGVQMDELQRGADVQVVDMAGNVCRAVPTELQRSLRESARAAGSAVPAAAAVDAATDMNMLFCVGQSTVALRAGVTGPRVAKADVGEPILGAAIVDRRGEKVCLAVTLKSLHVLSLPHLRPITRVQRHNRAHEERLSIAHTVLSLDGGGDFVEVANSVDVCMWTVFAGMARPGLPSLLLYKPTSMPMAPNVLGSVASSVANWIGGRSTALSQGAQLDDVLAGGSAKRAAIAQPKLPEPKHVQDRVHDEARRAAVQQELSRRADLASAAGPGARLPPNSARSASTAATTAQGANAAASQAAWSLDLAKQRGELVSSLEQGLSNLERGASDWMKSAREEMIKQAAKDKLTKFF